MVLCFLRVGKAYNEASSLSVWLTQVQRTGTGKQPVVFTSYRGSVFWDFYNFWSPKPAFNITSTSQAETVLPPKLLEIWKLVMWPILTSQASSVHFFFLIELKPDSVISYWTTLCLGKVHRFMFLGEESHQKTLATQCIRFISIIAVLMLPRSHAHRLGLKKSHCTWQF